MRLEKTNRHDNLSDLDLINRYKSTGDIYHLGDLFCRYLHLVYGVCLSRTGKRQIAQDACLGVFEKVYLLIREDEITNFRPWLFGISNSYCSLFLEENSKIGFLKEKIGGKELLSFDMPKEVPFSFKSIWHFYDNNKGLLDIDVAEQHQLVLNAFYKQEKCFDELVNMFNLSISELISIVDSTPRYVIGLLSNDQTKLLKGNVDSEKVKSWDAFLRYLINDISSKEKNAFERSIICHPFYTSLLVSMDGYAGVSIDADLDVLKRRIHRRSGYEQQDMDLNINWRLVSIIVGLVLFLGLIFFLVLQFMSSKKEIKEVPRTVISSGIISTPDTLVEIKEKVVFQPKEEKVIEKVVADTNEKKKEKNETKLLKKTLDDKPQDSSFQLEKRKLPIVALEKMETISPVFVGMTKPSVIDESTLDADAQSFSPIIGEEKYKDYLVNGMSQSNFTVSGDLLVDIFLDKEGNVEKVNVVKGFGSKEDALLANLIKTGSTWKGSKADSIKKSVIVRKQISL